MIQVFNPKHSVEIVSEIEFSEFGIYLFFGSCDLKIIKR